MRRAIFLTVAAVALSIGVASAQQGYTYTITRTNALKINWLPEQKTAQRYTVGVNFAPLVNLGMKFDFEYELPAPGEWIQAGLIGYVAPPRWRERTDWWTSYGPVKGNDRVTPGSGFDGFHRMWGVGVSAIYKKIFSRRGWYFSAGLVLELFRVGHMESGYFPFTEDGLTFYEKGRKVATHSYVKPSAQVNFGKHFALSKRCFLDLSVGFSASYSIYDSNKALPHNSDGRIYDTMYGFAYRGFNVFNGGARFGVLLWR